MSETMAGIACSTMAERKKGFMRWAPAAGGPARAGPQGRPAPRRPSPPGNFMARPRRPIRRALAARRANALPSAPRLSPGARKPRQQCKLDAEVLPVGREQLGVVVDRSLGLLAVLGDEKAAAAQADPPPRDRQRADGLAREVRRGRRLVVAAHRLVVRERARRRREAVLRCAVPEQVDHALAG